MLPDVAALATDQAAHEDKENLIETAEREEWIFGQVYGSSTKLF